MSSPTRIGIARVGPDGLIRYLNSEARELLGSCEGIGCSGAIRARKGDEAPACNGCFDHGHDGGSRHRSDVVVRDQHMRLTCSPVGEEVVVVIEPVGLGVAAWTEPLTRREQEVLSLVARGHTTPHIARALDVQPATVRTHVEHAREKLGASTRAEAVARAIATGQIR